MKLGKGLSDRSSLYIPGVEKGVKVDGADVGQTSTIPTEGTSDVPPA